MKFTRLGNSGLMVSQLCLGCMSYGDTSKGWHGDWLLDEDASRPVFRQALEGGINFFDTANGYSGGASEEITGKLLRELQPDMLIGRVEDEPDIARPLTPR